MSQTLPANNFKWVEDNSEFNEDFIKSYNDESDEGYFLEVDVQYPENLRNLQNNDWSFLPEWMKIEKVEKLIAILRDKTEYIIHIKYLKQALIMDEYWKKCIESLNLIKNLFKSHILI